MILYGIKNCDSVKKARKHLDGYHKQYAFYDFKNHQVTKEMIADWLQDVTFDQLLNKRSTTWKNLSESEKAEPTVELLCKYPTLIKRPVLENHGKVYVGYKSETYDKLA
ncbi:MAG: Spx/MgsR family RNA polymerase-binding regulatory protein [Pseudomonadota bacterium]|nr:arsenate reductase [Magnetococcales bacterium]MEC8467620.1 Spx/MgsR family RNA polymerase-binding regulatory protein [Pseudomonadota bacterium]|tara:strand:- start:8277 stop:8603 length:327 start_codon:yes stop_codon:yes gene_type:complete